MLCRIISGVEYFKSVSHGRARKSRFPPLRGEGVTQKSQQEKFAVICPDVET